MFCCAEGQLSNSIISIPKSFDRLVALLFFFRQRSFVFRISVWNAGFHRIQKDKNCTLIGEYNRSPLLKTPISVTPSPFQPFCFIFCVFVRKNRTFILGFAAFYTKSMDPDLTRFACWTQPECSQQFWNNLQLKS